MNSLCRRKGKEFPSINDNAISEPAGEVAKHHADHGDVCIARARKRKDALFGIRSHQPQARVLSDQCAHELITTDFGNYPVNVVVQAKNQSFA
jgi:hypothetical protein